MGPDDPFRTVERWDGATAQEPEHPPAPRFVVQSPLLSGFLLGSLYGVLGVTLGGQAFLLVLLCGAVGAAMAVAPALGRSLRPWMRRVADRLLAEGDQAR